MTSDDWDRRYDTPELIWSGEPNRFLRAEVEGLVPGRALDLASGEGRNAVWLARLGWQVTAVDFSEKAAEKARRLAGEHGVDVRLIQADLADYVPERDSADLVAIFYLQVSPALRSRVLGRAADALAPGGVMLVVGHDLLNLTGGVGGPRDPAVLMTPESVVGDLRGLVIERAERVTRPVTTAEGQVHAIDTLVRARRPREER
jgi:SAM-dependent methyltransferase